MARDTIMIKMLAAGGWGRGVGGVGGEGEGEEG